MKELSMYSESIIDVAFMHYCCNDLHFTPRESECFLYARIGLSAKEIARKLSISYRTVEKHFENMRAKSSCRSLVELIFKVSNEYYLRTSTNRFPCVDA